jgi:hypothetical protein
MTEREWLKTRYPDLVFDHLRSALGAPRTKKGRRRLRLVACGCCRLIWQHLTDSRLTRAIEVAERFADGEAEKVEMEKARKRLEKLWPVTGGFLPSDPGAQALTVACMVAGAASIDQPMSSAEGMLMFPLPLAGYRGTPGKAKALIADLVRDIFGNPFRPVTFSPAWRTDTAVALARQMYESRDFGAMPILADALQDAGCDSEDILNHCRDTSLTHVRGCWVTDLVLGKE